jgi:hypothetical protein
MCTSIKVFVHLINFKMKYIAHWWWMNMKWKLSCSMKYFSPLYEKVQGWISTSSTFLQFMGDQYKYFVLIKTFSNSSPTTFEVRESKAHHKIPILVKNVNLNSLFQVSYGMWCITILNDIKNYYFYGKTIKFKSSLEQNER